MCCAYSKEGAGTNKLILRELLGPLNVIYENVNCFMFCSDVAWNLDTVILRMLMLNAKILTILILFFFFLPNSFVFVIPRIKSLTGLFLRPPSRKHYHNKQNMGQVDTITLLREDQRGPFILFDFKTIKSNVTYLARKKLANNGPLHFIVYCYWSFIWFCVFMCQY